MPETIKVLLVEDDDDHASLIRRYVASVDRTSIALTRVGNLTEAFKEIREDGIEAILLDLGLPDSTVPETLTRVLQEAPHVPVIVLTSLNDREVAVGAVQQGAQDYLVKSQLTGELLVRSVQYAVQRKRAEEQLRRLNETLEQRVLERTAQLQQRTSQLRALASELTLSEQRERRRLSTELHDYLAQMLVACKLKLTEIEQILVSEGKEEQVEQMRKLLDDSLTYTRTLIAELSPSILYTSGLAPAVRWLGEHMKRQHDLEVQVSTEGHFGEIPEDTGVLIFQTIRELLYNVVKHAGVNSATVDMVREGPKLTVAVKDEGRGFGTPINTVSALSGKFGLFNVQERLEAMGGKFSIESYPGRGSRISFSLQLPDTAGAAADAGNENGKDSAEPKRQIKVLVADDHKLVREGLRRMINRFENVQVVGEAEDGEQAVELARSLVPDAIIMDINMPRMNGLEATKIIKEVQPDISVIGHSVHDDEEVVASLRQAGITTYLVKGSSSQELYRALSVVWRDS